MFFLVFNLLGMYLIFGAIIDSFTISRHKKQRVEQNLRAQCFICDISRDWFDSKFEGYEKHILHEHRLSHYISYIYYLRNKPFDALSGQERLIVQLMQQSDASWIPSQRSLTLEQGGLYSQPGLQMDLVLDRLCDFEETIDTATTYNNTYTITKAFAMSTDSTSAV